MGKTYRRDQQYRPRKQGRVFTKDQNWKKHKHNKNWDKPPLEDQIPPDGTTQENIGP